MGRIHDEEIGELRGEIEDLKAENLRLREAVRKADYLLANVTMRVAEPVPVMSSTTRRN